MENKRSVGLIILGVLFILHSLLSFKAMFLNPAVAKNLFFLAYGTFYVIALVITGVGILILKRWARLMALLLITIKMIQLIVGGIIDINRMIRGSAETGLLFLPISLLVVTFLIGSGIIYYLIRSKIKEQFK